MKKQILTHPFASFGLIWLLLLTPLKAGAEEEKIPVKIAPVTQQVSVPTISMKATLYSRHQNQVTAANDGQLDWVAEPGTYFTKGQAVAKMDFLPLELKLNEQLAQLERATINLNFQNRELERLEILKKQHSISSFEIDQTRSKRDLAASDLKINKIQIQQIKDQMRRAIIVAPYDGVITERLHYAGENVTSSDLIVRMLDTRYLEARSYVPLKYMPYVRVGDELLISTPGHQLRSQVNAIIPSIDLRSQTFELIMTIPEQASKYWTAGQLVNIALPVNHKQQLLTVHRDALIIRRDGVYVFRINQANKAQKVKVSLSEGGDDWISVNGELEEGDSVVTRGGERLDHDQEVIISY